MVAAGHTERAWGCNAGLPRSACLAGASRFEALLLNHRRRLPDAIVLVNAPHTLLSADNRRWAARACRRSAARPDLVSLECELDEGRQNGTSFTTHAHAVHRSFLCSLCLILLRACAWAGWAVEVTALAARCRRGTVELITFVLADISVFVAVISFPVHDIAAVMSTRPVWEPCVVGCAAVRSRVVGASGRGTGARRPQCAT